ncbi:flagellar biosynthetic protein FliO [Phycicoccus sp. MAQZ13P-2]|uniref:flagellar biosynthetic protein FliO n=1 Tax=Phycicoccus mangrovi TaxID=2840470 RepID=UPI001C0067E8|nr:flagellar biosynthetic protein FliO [Phycicoccus mangrovi]MBT9254954.1 flagellar biosynthetic protein FliO [Phycicoccus mangrovi]MBT9256049.1 flagellar biosynthetic protein FliO [Phycicoccus mangrovi]MBT9273938.1 flagellar biosynthetic protein FliO [Phycicoccus mangrovi]
MDGSVVLVVLRLLVSLGVVLTLLVLLARWARKRGLGGAVGSRAGVQVEVLSRRALGRGSALHVVRVGEQVLVLGVTDQHVSLLRELDPQVLEVVEPEQEAPVVAAPTVALAPAAAPDFAAALRAQADGTGLDLGPAATVPVAVAPVAPATRGGRHAAARRPVLPRPTAPAAGGAPVPTGWPWNAASLVVGAIKGSRA